MSAELVEIDCKKAVDYLTNWIAEKITSAGKSGGIVGLSGGLDSSVTAALVKRACGEEALGLIMPCHSSYEDRQDALLAAGEIGIVHQKLELDEVFDLLREQLQQLAPGEDKMAAANIKPRLRMTALYYLAARKDYLVVGTDNWSELSVGYFTKYGDGGIDIAPLGRLVKTEVREVARYLGLPAKIINRQPSAGLWEGQTDEGEMGLSYAELDSYILGNSLSPELEEKIEEMRKNNRHKLEPPPVPERENLTG